MNGKRILNKSLILNHSTATEFPKLRKSLRTAKELDRISEILEPQSTLKGQGGVTVRKVKSAERTKIFIV